MLQLVGSATSFYQSPFQNIISFIASPMLHKDQGVINPGKNTAKWFEMGRKETACTINQQM